MTYRDDKLRAAAAVRRLTHDQIAEISGVSRPNITQVLNGKQEPRLSTLKAIADALGLQMAELFEPLPENEQRAA